MRCCGCRRLPRTVRSRPPFTPGPYPCLSRALQDPSWTAATEQTGAYGSLPPAVVLDLDETVLDNSAFQGQLVRDRQSYTEAAWADWVRAGQAGAVPGAQAFIHAVEERGVRVFYVSNRAAAQEASTLANLRSLGLDTTGDRVLSPGEQGWTTDKSPRRAFIAEHYRVLMLVGDDLGDFVAIARLSPAEREALVDRYADRWLERWVLLPNASYGSWLRALTPGLSTDRDVLERKLQSSAGTARHGPRYTARAVHRVRAVQLRTSSGRLTCDAPTPRPRESPAARF